MSVDDIAERVVIEQTLLKANETFVYKVRLKISRILFTYFMISTYVLSNFLLSKTGSTNGN